MCYCLNLFTTFFAAHLLLSFGFVRLIMLAARLHRIAAVAALLLPLCFI